MYKKQNIKIIIFYRNIHRIQSKKKQPTTKQPFHKLDSK